MFTFLENTLIQRLYGVGGEWHICRGGWLFFSLFHGHRHIVLGYIYIIYTVFVRLTRFKLGTRMLVVYLLLYEGTTTDRSVCVCSFVRLQVGLRVRNFYHLRIRQ